MNRTGSVAFFVIGLLWAIPAHGDQWSLSAGGTGDDWLVSAEATTDGRVLAAGYTGSFGVTGVDGWVVKLNDDTTVAWQKTYGESGSDYLNDVRESPSGGYVAAGSTGSFGAVGSDGWILKLNTDGTVVWEKRYGGGGADILNAVRPTSDGGYVATGRSSSYSGGNDDGWVLKLDGSGSVAWAKTYGGAGNEDIRDIAETPDGGYVIAGKTASFGVTGLDAWVVKLNADGTVAWEKSFGDTGNEELWTVLAEDDGYVVMGFTNSFGASDDDFWVLKLNLDGTVAWQKRYGGANRDRGYGLDRAADGGYLMTGYTQSFGAGGADVWVLKINRDGGLAWQRTYGDAADNELAMGIRALPDGGVVAVGNGLTSKEALLLKLDFRGRILGCGDVGVSTATAADTNAVGVTTTATVADVVVTPASTTATAAASGATPAAGCSNTPSISLWGKAYGGVRDDFVGEVAEVSEGGYIVAGYSDSFGAGYGKYDAWVLRLGDDGAVLWEKAYGGSDADGATSIRQTRDGGYVVAGYTDSFGAGGMDAWLLKLNNDGTVAWEKALGGLGDEYAGVVRQTSDGGYVIAGSTGSLGPGGQDAWVVKLDSNGTVVWEKAYGGSDDDGVSAIEQTPDGGYVVAGSTRSFGGGYDDFWIMKLNGDGTVVWQKTYGGPAPDFAYAVKQTSDGSYVVAGSTWSFGAGDLSMWVLKLNADGTVAWEKTYGGPAAGSQESASALEIAADGSYVVGGHTLSFGGVWIVKLAPDGAIVSQTADDYVGNDVKSIRATADGGFVAAAESSDFRIFRLDPEALIGCGGSASAAVVETTHASVSDSTATVTDTAAAIAATTATVTDTGASVGYQCASIGKRYLLRILRNESGTGTVSDPLAGIDCGADCMGFVMSGTGISLSQVPDPGSYFAGWSGACDGGGHVVADADKTCTATFNSIVDFSGTPRSGLASLQVDFTDLSTNSPTNWLWDFGNGATSALQDPVYTYDAPGSYLVSLTASGGSGSGSMEKADYITVTCGSGVETVRYGTPPSTWTAAETLQAAYDDAGGGETIEAMSMNLSGYFLFDLDKGVTLSGGFNCDYSSNNAFSTVVGSITIGGPGSGTGSLILENIAVR